MNLRHEDAVIAAAPVLGELNRIDVRLPHLPVQELDKGPELHWYPVGYEQQAHPARLQ
ncbi:hypothetical protein OG280_10615 [Streptomyces virginiae]|uniref:hypothetical protein n=1 Tax=Streptomyces virginiae TaxID=1961 RepID=UPI00324958F8